VGIAIVNTAFKVLSTVILLPMSSILEKLAIRLVPDSKEESMKIELDERLLATPTLALEQCHSVAADMANCAVKALKRSLKCLKDYVPSDAEEIRQSESLTDKYEDVLGTYLIKLSSSSMSDDDSEEAAKLLKVIGDFERISDHAVNILDSAEEIKSKRLELTPSAEKELAVMMSATEEILELSLDAFVNNNMDSAVATEPLEQVIDDLKRKLRTRHIVRMQQGECSIEMGFVWSDLLTNLERTSDHCSNIAGSVLETANHNLNLHETLRAARSGLNTEFSEKFSAYSEKYSL
jgi:phosphate:Na+ symporter